MKWVKRYITSVHIPWPRTPVAREAEKCSLQSSSKSHEVATKQLKEQLKVVLMAVLERAWMWGGTGWSNASDNIN